MNTLPTTLEWRRGPEILIVEDDRTFEPIWSHILAKANGLSIYDWAISVTEAKQKIEQKQARGGTYDLLITDIFLAGTETGLDLWRFCEKDFSNRFAIVSSIDYLDVLKAFKGAPPVYIRKPLNIESCIEIVYELLKP